MNQPALSTSHKLANVTIRSRRLIDWIFLFVNVAALLCFILPLLIADYGGYFYYVRGIDMVTGRKVLTDKYGMVPQLQISLTFLAIVLSMAACLIKNRAKSVFLSALLNLTALVMFIYMFAMKDAAAAKFDPIRAAVQEGNIQYGFYIMIAVLTLALILSVYRASKNMELVKDIRYSYWLYILAAPVVIYAIIFYYYPMYGIIIAFKDFNPILGIMGSPFAGFKHFMSFFNSHYFFRLIRNTLMINIYEIIFAFPAPIIFALLLNEINSSGFKRTVQTVTYLPHFISLVVICGLILDFFSTDGLVNKILALLGVDESKLVNYMGSPKYFRSIFVGSGIWQNLGWGSIIYLSAISTISPELYEAAVIDGANRWHKIFHITLAGIAPTVIIMFILRLGSLLNVGFEKIILLYNAGTYETADVISSFVYRKGLQDGDYSYSAAVGLFNSIISFILVYAANKVSSKVSETSLW